MRSLLIWVVRLCALVGWVATAVACFWLLGATAMPRPWTEPYVWGAVAVACAVVRVLALWGLRVLPGENRTPGEPVSLSKVADRRSVSGSVSLSEALGFSFSDLDEARGWIKLRTGAVWALVAFASGAFFVALLTSANAGEKLDDLRTAGAEASTATVVGGPQAIREELTDEHAVKGYVSRLVVSVPGGPGRLPVRGAYTYDRPRAGTEVDVLWARSAPELGGYVNESKNLRVLAEARWNAFADDELGVASLLAFLVIVVVFGGVLGVVFTLAPQADVLQRLAGSAPFQTVRAALAVAVFWAWSPTLLGHEAGVLQLLLAGASFLLVLLGYVCTSVRSFVR
ncbi:hypothetical protein BJ965_001353 [Streptomyces luteogriseus]|uniref:Uncharacterized protein n=1 Tax=Streptomyces luteogriseus TaxID=68233 RepID=A0A7W7DIP5_9ACTN|nr:hypothetical protein [Streptomyces luteogriseus]MBB4711471.1 hypothetical protein [Streptomyces luteogriseus]